METRLSADDLGALSRRAAPALAILPLRVFLGVTFIDAGLGKLVAPAYFGSGPQSFAALARSFAHATPLAGIIRSLVLPHPLVWSVLLAAAEATVGAMTLVGLGSRLAAAMGLVLSLSFFLTADWHTHPYFYGADLPFAFGWLVILIAGAAGLPSVDRWLVRRQRLAAGLHDDVGIRVPMDRLHRVCAEADSRGRCASFAGRACAGAHCPLVNRVRQPVAEDAKRRAFLGRAALGGMTLAGISLFGGLAAAVSRLIGSGEAPARRSATSLGAGTTTSPGPSVTTKAPAAAITPPGTRIGNLRQIPVGQAGTFTAANGDPAVAVRLTSTQIVAYDAVCTHAGCTVTFDPSSRLLFCPCHDGEFDPAHGAQVVAGPPPTPLAKLTVRLSPDGSIYVS